MERLSPFGLDAASFASQSQQIAERYRELAKDRQMTVASDEQNVQTAHESILSLYRRLQVSAPRDWHESAIQYLDLDAAIRDLTRWSPQDESARQLRESLPEIERRLRFNLDDANPSASRLQSPARFDPDELRRALLSKLKDFVKPNPNDGQDQAHREPSTSTPSVANET
jgi:hypothetical protein